ncbi:MAG: ribonuclease HII [Gemmatimonadales bacterium]
MPSLEREQRAWQCGRLLLGVDEAGRGPLAGPVVAAAVIFPQGVKRFRRIKDSKTLPEAKRDVAARLIREEALAVGVGAASVREIDRLNIRRATVLAMRRAIRRCLPSGAAPGIPLDISGTRCEAVEIVLDGLAMPDLGFDHDAIVDGDALCLSISAAGIIAKTVRDRLMVALAERHPGYEWVTNRGYGTEAHRRAIDEHGPTRHHRRSFMPVMQLGLGI